MKAFLVNYNFTPTWLFDYPELEYYLYDRSDSPEYLKDFPQERTIKTTNVGNVDYDKLSMLVDNYDTLPDVFLWGKSNLFKYITKEEFDLVKDNKFFTPLLTKNHRTYKDRLGEVCRYEGGIYRERNDSWFLNEHYSKHFRTWNDWAREFQLPQPAYIPFAPGGNYILTATGVRQYSRDYYDKMRQTMGYTQLPGEAQCAERSYYLMWK